MDMYGTMGQFNSIIFMSVDMENIFAVGIVPTVVKMLLQETMFFRLF